MTEIMNCQKIHLLLIILLIAALCFTAVPVSAAQDPAFCFSLQVDGNAEKHAAPGDIITVVFTLERTDSADPYAMYAMQNEIRYDSTFFELIDDSLIVREGIVTRDIRVSDREHELYMNFLSLSGGIHWTPKTNVGSFQMRVIGESGSSVISCRDCSVSRPDGSGSYSLVTSDMTVIVSEECSVTFDSRGGTPISSQTVITGERAKLPALPERDGYLFTGWYTDEVCTEKWQFSEPVTANLCLYAGWESEVDEQPMPFEDIETDDWYYDSVRYVYKNGLMNGVGDTAFAPDTETSRAMAVTILWRMEGSPIVQTPMQFADVAAGQWYTEAVRWASSEDIVKGYSAAEFGVNDTITREQLAAILYRYAAYKGHDVSSDTDMEVFHDAAAVSTWALDAMKWSVGSGLIQGTGDDTLHPAGFATRAQTAAILMRFRIWG